MQQGADSYGVDVVHREEDMTFSYAVRYGMLEHATRLITENPDACALDGALTGGYAAEQTLFALVDRGLASLTPETAVEAYSSDSIAVARACIAAGCSYEGIAQRVNRKASEGQMVIAALAEPDKMIYRWDLLAFVPRAVNAAVATLDKEAYEDKKTLVMKLATSGYLEELKMLEGYDGYYDTDVLVKTIESANAEGHIETVAYLIDLKDKLEEEAGQAQETTEELPAEGSIAESQFKAADNEVELARQIVDLAKTLILADNHFLASAIGRLPVVAVEGLGAPFATDGFSLAYDPHVIVEQFNETGGAAPKHDLLHCVFHCAFLHVYNAPTENTQFWTLASDIIVERAVADCCGHRPGSDGARISDALCQIELSMGGRSTASKIYTRLCNKKWKSKVAEWSELFHSDSHDVWYETGPVEAPDDLDETRRRIEALGKTADGIDLPTIGEEEGAKNATDAKDEVLFDDGSAYDESVGSEEGDGVAKNKSGELEEVPIEDEAGDEEIIYTNLPFGARLHILNPLELDSAQESWRAVATGLAINLQTYAKTRGQSMPGLISDLEQIAMPPVDYRDFLRQFAISGEVMRLSEDEFDYVFYMLGLELYGNLPLIEPVEYREDKRIKEFVIVIDTSGSVQGELIRKFIATTFDILSSTESFHQKVHVRIIQCDAKVQSDDIITSLDQMKEWNRTMKILGCGGTDYRPAFQYVNDLIAAGEFEDLGGLVYFTDGWGKYPETAPGYKTAFCFYDENYRLDIVPPWAMQVILDSETINRAAEGIYEEETMLAEALANN